MPPPAPPVAQPDAVRRRPHTAGKFIYAGGEKLYIRGVTYGTFRPGPDGREQHDPAQVVFCKGVAVASCRLLARLDRSGLPQRVFRAGAPGPAARPAPSRFGGAAVRHVCNY